MAYPGTRKSLIQPEPHGRLAVAMVILLALGAALMAAYASPRGQTEPGNYIFLR